MLVQHTHASQVDHIISIVTFTDRIMTTTGMPWGVRDQRQPCALIILSQRIILGLIIRHEDLAAKPGLIVD